MLVRNDYIELAVYIKAGDQVSINILNYGLSMALGDQADEQGVLDAMTSNIRDKYAAVLSSSARFMGCSLRKLFPLPAGGYYYKKDPKDGDVALDMLPKQTAYCISWRTPEAGRSRRGRTYIPFPAEADNDLTAVPTAAYMTALGALASKLMDTGILATAAPVSFQAFLQVYNRDPVHFTTVDHRVTPTKWATMRRRGDYGRPNKVPDPLS